MSAPARPPIADVLGKKILVFDGAMGTMLYAEGVPFTQCFDAMNTARPDVVRLVHMAYVSAGADIIETNTFGGNRFRLAEHGLEKEVAAINRAGARLAREAAGDRAWVAGSVGPIGRPLAPIGTIPPEEAEEAFREQIAALVEGGIDLLVIETIGDMNEMERAVAAARSAAPGIPVIAQMTFSEEGKTLIGNKPAEIARRLSDLGVAAVGANCSVGPQGILDVIERMSSTSRVPLVAQPNAGLPHLVGGRLLYLATPEYFEEYARRLVEAGASLIGGCCGTTPEHIAAIRRGTAGLALSSAARVNGGATIEVAEPEPTAPAAPAAERSTFGSKLGRRFVISVEIDPPRGLDLEKYLHGALMLRQKGADAINIADSPLGRARMAPMAMGHLIERSVGIESIIHVCCRDRNLLALQSELLGAHALGLRNLMLITGDPVLAGDALQATDVFDLDSIGLIRLAAALNKGVDLAGKSVDRPTSFVIGCAANPTAVDIERDIDRLREKVEAGADYVFTQPLYDPRDLETYLARVTDLKVPICVGVLPLRNHRHSEFLHHEVPGMRVPESIREEMRKAGEQGAAAGVAIARRFLTEVQSMVAGAYLMPPFNRFDMAADVMEGFVEVD
ncbi:MAG TPA: bifunctional homocysteine S-methyltransferase/methylenetetrahydrofolate reductase [Candidatus Eisenbacteria bacterium]